MGRGFGTPRRWRARRTLSRSRRADERLGDVLPAVVAVAPGLVRALDLLDRLRGRVGDGGADGRARGAARDGGLAGRARPAHGGAGGQAGRLRGGRERGHRGGGRDGRCREAGSVSRRARSSSRHERVDLPRGATVARGRRVRVYAARTAGARVTSPQSAGRAFFGHDTATGERSQGMRRADWLICGKLFPFSKLIAHRHLEAEPSVKSLSVRGGAEKERAALAF